MEYDYQLYIFILCLLKVIELLLIKKRWFTRLTIIFFGFLHARTWVLRATHKPLHGSHCPPHCTVTSYLTLSLKKTIGSGQFWPHFQLNAWFSTTNCFNWFSSSIVGALDDPSL